MTSSLHIETDQRGVCTLTLNRPERHNAFDAELIDELLSALKNISNDDEIRIVIITGSGESFSSGADLNWMRSMVDYDEETNRQDAQQLSNLMHSLYALSKPTIACVNGPAFGGGIGLIACCDIAIATNTAQFAFTEVRLGMAPAVISPYILMTIGPRQARRLFLTAERFDSHEALSLGLVHQVTDLDELDEAIDKQVHHLLKAGPEAVKACKSLTQNTTDEHELSNLIARLRTSAEGQEGLKAFLEKRKPSWVKS